MGWLTRLHGLTIDNLRGAEVVIADGRILHASETDNADLFWAIRGGGGNFGVVTEFEFQLHEVTPTVHYGFFFWDAADDRAAMGLMRDVTAELPCTMNVMAIAAMTAPPAPFVPTQHWGRTGYGLMLVGFGGATEHATVVSQIRRTVSPLFDWVTAMPYVAVQQLMDEALRSRQLQL
jgi:FAD/FMN-containing dehydrogenase